MMTIILALVCGILAIVFLGMLFGLLCTGICLWGLSRYDDPPKQAEPKGSNNE